MKQPVMKRTAVRTAAGVLVMLSAATWSTYHAMTAGPVPGPDELALDGGLVRVDGVVSAARPGQAMPGMGTDKDPVADGHRRVSVDVTLVAGARPMEYAARLFALTVDGEPAVRLTRRDVLPGELLPERAWMSGTIMFDVPRDAVAGELSYDGRGAVAVELPPEQARTRTVPTDEVVAPHGPHAPDGGAGTNG